MLRLTGGPWAILQNAWPVDGSWGDQQAQITVSDPAGL
jgi:hypothetical protein